MQNATTKSTEKELSLNVLTIGRWWGAFRLQKKSNPKILSSPEAPDEL